MLTAAKRRGVAAVGADVITAPAELMYAVVLDAGRTPMTSVTGWLFWGRR